MCGRHVCLCGHVAALVRLCEGREPGPTLVSGPWFHGYLCMCVCMQEKWGLALAKLFPGGEAMG